MATSLFDKVLIANRGEIALRIIRTCREMGLKTVVAHSEADATTPAVLAADEAVCLGAAAASESYLNIEKLIAAAKKTGAGAIHPGYGFLSEKAPFSAACEKAGIIFIGPKAHAISSMGDKVEARKIAEAAGVPTVPGTKEPVADLKELKAAAKNIGFPMLLKAAAGGGGKGMRVVRAESELESSFQMASGEALKSFGDGRVYAERFVEKPRHVEIQIARDSHGNGLFLLERECSMQRRHQKVIEEAPCAYLRDEVRQKMASCSLSLAASVDYLGVGTIEFLVDAEQNFYFLEMNTRLQVEHTVTEMITGLDLVRLQVLIAQGQKIPYAQKDIVARGHAIQCRVYAEDPANGFLPSPGKVVFLQAPQGPGIRHDGGVESGGEITTFYDPMIAKLMAFAESRPLAIERMCRALKEYKILGPKTNLAFLHRLASCDAFRDLSAHTQYIDSHPELAKDPAPSERVIALALSVLEKSAPQTVVGSVSASGMATESVWAREGLFNLLDRRL